MAIVAVPVLQFAALGLAALVIVGLAVSVASKRVGEREAIVNARSEALVKAQAVVEPILVDSVVKVDPSEVERIDKAVRRDVLDDSLVRVKIWRADGTILYSDEERLVGSRYVLGDEETQALHTGNAVAEVSDLSRPENRFERPAGKLLEVYLPVRTPDGTRVLFEAYFRYGSVAKEGRDVWRSFAPVSLGALVVLELLQIPLAFGLAQRLRRRQLERERLLARAVGASSAERRRIAADLHDGVVQDLAGVSYTLSAASRSGEPPSGEALEAAATSVRAAIESLRSLVVEIYPPNLAEEGLGPALADLTARASAAGVAIDLDTSALPASLPQPVAELLYRTVQEAVRNVLTHASASSVRIRAWTSSGRAAVEVIDDGVGFDVAAAAARPDEGHVGIRGLRDLADDLDGTLTIESTPGSGTMVRTEVPIP
jgi:signal transduction histidine kinase